MPRWTLLFGFAVLLFVAGIFAGQSVHSQGNDEARHGSPDNAEQSLDPDAALSPEVTPSRFINASHQTFTNDDDSVDDQKISARPERTLPDQTVEVTKPAVANSANRTAISELIKRMFPDADGETAEIWIDTYSDMPLSDVEFILQQKQQLSGSFAHRTPSLVEEAGTGSKLNPASTPIDAVRTNLRNAWSVGFRRTVVLPAVSTSEPTTNNRSRSDSSATTFTCFDSGRMISSPVSTHVSLSATDGALMFYLDGGRFTRRGDFLLLPDRRLGLMTEDGAIAIKDSPVIPEAATRIRIAANAEIQFNDVEQSRVAGRVPVVRISELASLNTNDGVLFELAPDQQPSPVEPAEVVLMLNSLEISNVHYDEESQLLDQLRQTGAF